MDKINPVEWFSWIYGKTGHWGFLPVAAIGVFFLWILWLRGADKYKEGQAKEPEKPSSTIQSSQGSNSPNISTGDNSPVTVNNYFDSPDSKIRREEKRLLTDYPLGYAVLAADAMTIKLPTSLNVERKFQLSWTSAKILSLTANQIQFALPDVFAKNGTGKYYSNTYVFPRKVGKYYPALNLDLVDGRTNARLVIEVLDNQKDFVVLVVGFISVQ